jgi:hypothetical protein
VTARVAVVEGLEFGPVGGQHQGIAICGQVCRGGAELHAGGAVGSILYSTYVLETNDAPRGLFIVAHLSAGERTEALSGVYVFTKLAVGVVIVAFLLAWFASHRILKPVQDLALTARSISINSPQHNSLVILKSD